MYKVYSEEYKQRLIK